MELKDVQFSVAKKDGRVVGFKLVGVGETEAECFCYSFPSAVQRGKGDVQVRENRIIFIHKGITHDDDPDVNGIWGTSSGGEFVADLPTEEAIAINKLLNCKDEYAGHKIVVKRIFGFGKGFELTARA